jgi:hypothetical protein
MSTGGHLSGGKFPTLAMAGDGFLFTDLVNELITDVTARFLDNRYNSVFDSDLYDSIFNASDTSVFANSGVDAGYLKDAVHVKYDDSANVVYNDDIVTSSIKQTEITAGTQGASVSTSYRVSGVKVGFN